MVNKTLALAFCVVFITISLNTPFIDFSFVINQKITESSAFYFTLSYLLNTYF